MKRSSVPNLITGSRIALSLLLLALAPLGAAYLAVYALAGLTDMADGALARRWNVASVLGSWLDTVADITMLGVALATLWPYLPLTGVLLGWFSVVAAVKVFSLALYYAKQRAVLSHHSTLNKVVGALLYLYPFALAFAWRVEAACALLALATAAAIEEFGAVKTGKV
jgi:CDP-diacylglycerol--glycerol-3-phosphate 3-phosphatidyltransferase